MANLVAYVVFPTSCFRVLVVVSGFSFIQSLKRLWLIFRMLGMSINVFDMLLQVSRRLVKQALRFLGHFFPHFLSFYVLIGYHLLIWTLLWFWWKFIYWLECFGVSYWHEIHPFKMENWKKGCVLNQRGGIFVVVVLACTNHSIFVKFFNCGIF